MFKPRPVVCCVLAAGALSSPAHASGVFSDIVFVDTVNAFNGVVDVYEYRVFNDTTGNVITFFGGQGRDQLIQFTGDFVNFDFGTLTTKLGRDLPEFNGQPVAETYFTDDVLVPSLPSSIGAADNASLLSIGPIATLGIPWIESGRTEAVAVFSVPTGSPAPLQLTPVVAAGDGPLSRGAPVDATPGQLPSLSPAPGQTLTPGPTSTPPAPAASGLLTGEIIKTDSLVTNAGPTDVYELRITNQTGFDLFVLEDIVIAGDFLQGGLTVAQASGLPTVAGQTFAETYFIDDANEPQIRPDGLTDDTSLLSASSIDVSPEWVPDGATEAVAILSVPAGSPAPTFSANAVFEIGGRFAVEVVPEPTAAACLLFGSGLLVGRGRRRRVV